MNRLRPFVLVGLVASTAINPAAGWTQAVSIDAASLMGRLDSIERRLGTIENRGTGRAAGAAPAPTAAPSSYTFSDISQQIEDLSREVTQTSGKQERIEFVLQSLAQKFDDFARDVDLRLNDIENRQKQLATAPQPQAASAASSATPATQPVATTSISVPEGMTATDMYNRAYAYLSATDYPNAEAWLTEFLKRHPKDKLAENAWYWLGEVQMVRNNPTGAVVSFRNGLREFPKGSKTPANLFKMGMALEQLKQPELAKGAWDKLIKDHPKSPEAARAKDKLITLKPATP